MFFESLLINVSVIVILLAALIFDYVTKFFSYWYIRHIQYKTPVPFFGSDYHRVLNVRSTTDEVGALYTKHAGENYVGCFKSRIPELIVKDPRTVKRVLATDFSNFHYRGHGLDKSRDVCLRNNLFYAEGEKWTLLRKKFELLLNQMDDDIQHSLHDCLSGTNGVLNVQQILSGILDVVFKDLLLDNNVDKSIVKNIREKLEKQSLSGKLKNYLKDIFPSVYTLFGINHISPTDLNEMKKYIKTSKLSKNIEKVDKICDEELKRIKYNNISNIDNLNSTFMLFINEGYLPCYNLLTALLYEVAKNPSLQEKIRECDVNNINTNDLLDRVIKETLRLHPPYSVITRQCTKTYHCTEKEFLVDKGITIAIPVKNLHHDEKYYSRSAEFNPNRVLDSDTSEQAPVFLPFGLGPRKCIGERLAMRIIRCVTSAILKKHRLETTDKTPSTLQAVDYNFKRVINEDVWLKFETI